MSVLLSLRAVRYELLIHPIYTVAHPPPNAFARNIFINAYENKNEIDSTEEVDDAEWVIPTVDGQVSIPGYTSAARLNVRLSDLRVLVVTILR